MAGSRTPPSRSSSLPCGETAQRGWLVAGNPLAVLEQRLPILAREVKSAAELGMVVEQAVQADGVRLVFVDLVGRHAEHGEAAVPGVVGFRYETAMYGSEPMTITTSSAWLTVSP